MPKPKAVASLSGMVDTDMEDDTLANGFPTPDSNQENAPAKKRGRQGKAMSKKFANTRTRRSGDCVVPTKAAPKAKGPGRRAPLKEQKNVQQGENTEEVDEFDAPQNENDPPVQKTSRNQPTKRKAPGKKMGRPPKKNTEDLLNKTERDGEFEYTPTIARQTKRLKKGSAEQAPATETNERPPSAESQSHDKVIPETQIPMEIETSEYPKDGEEEEDALPQSVLRQSHNARSAGLPRQAPVARKGASNLSDTERASNDPATRRKLGEITRRFDNMELKYKSLKDTVAREAEVNTQKFETKLQAKSKGDIYILSPLLLPLKALAADDLIASLRKELALQKSLSRDSRSLQKEITARDADLAKTQALADQLSTSLAEAQNENKSLQAKLANSRSASAAVESLNAKTPGSVVNGKTPATRTVMVGSAEAAQAAQVAQLKEDLYSDLTGLILRGVERGEESDVYDCLQTGPNGSESSQSNAMPL